MADDKQKRNDPSNDPAVEGAMASVRDLLAARSRLAEAERTRDEAQKRVDALEAEVERAEEAVREVLDLPEGESDR